MKQNLKFTEKNMKIDEWMTLLIISGNNFNPIDVFLSLSPLKSFSDFYKIYFLRIGWSPSFCGFQKFIKSFRRHENFLLQFQQFSSFSWDLWHSFVTLRTETFAKTFVNDKFLLKFSEITYKSSVKSNAFLSSSHSSSQSLISCWHLISIQ